MKTAALFLATVVSAMAAATIPSLPWEPRSDWVTPAGLVGDGQADDTAAIQASLTAMHHGSTLYLPAGTYRITQTLRLTPAKRLSGILIVGHGRDTRLVWDGPEGDPMVIIGGAAGSRFVGLDLDGRGKASVGLYHLTKFFETEVHHRHLAFHGFTSAGILADKAPATAEVMTDNCLFEDCARGLAFTAFNDYDYAIDGCEFRRCGIAIDCRHGNFYARNCHFEGSTDTDFHVNPEHGSSIRRCTSIGSKTFVRFINPVAPLTIQDCRVEAWTNPDGAVILGGAPVVIFDTVFTKPPSDAAPVNVRNRGQRLLVSANTSAGTAAVIRPAKLDNLHEIPAGNRGGILTSASQTFLRDQVAIPGKVFDARRDFGAKGNRKTDDTAAIQAAIDAAREHGQGAIAYLPTGVYVVSKSLRVTGSDYYLGGSGFSTGLLWRGDEGGAIITVTDAVNVTIENLAVGNHDTAQGMANGMDILQTGGAVDSSVTYDNVNVFGMYQKQPFRQGLWLRDLRPGDTVRTPHVQGNIRLVNAARATVLLTNTWEGSITVEGQSPERGGFLGGLTRLSTICTHGLYVRDSQSFVASDFYIEQANNGYQFTGAPADPPGRITVSSPKLHTSAAEEIAITIDGYQGRIALGPTQFYIEPKQIKLIQRGQPAPDTILWGCSFYGTQLAPELATPASLALLGNAARGKDLDPQTIADQNVPAALEALSAALDDYRHLGEIDLRLNHPTQQ